VNTKNSTVSIVEEFFHGQDNQCRVFSWSIGYNPKEKTTLVVVLILFIELISPDLFAKKSLLSIESVYGKKIAIDEATQIKPRFGTTRVKIILDLVETLPNHIRLQFEDGKSGKLNEGSLDYTLKCLDNSSSLSTFNR
ncbi:hypothetical protein EJD97_010013, partial [Solanum chilense]